MKTQMTQTEIDRINEMVKDPKIQELMMSFKTKEQAQEFVTKAAIATLIIKQ